MREKAALNNLRSDSFALSPVPKEAASPLAVSSSRLNRRSSGGEAGVRRVRRRTVVLNSIDRSSVTATVRPGLNYIDQPGSYAIGEGFFLNSGLPTGDVFRDYFSFQVPRLKRGERVVGATLQVTRFNSSAGDAVETLGLFDVGTPLSTLSLTSPNVPNPVVFDDLGTGKNYGFFNVSTTGSPFELLSFRLNPTAVGEINRSRSRVFSIGGSLQSLNDTGTPIAENLFTLGNSGGIVRLVLQVRGR